MMQYDEYVSLGCDCGGGFQIRRVLGQDSSNFFNWNVTSLHALKRILENRFAGVVELANLSPHAGGSMLKDRLYDYYLHSPFDRPDYENDPDFRAKWVGLREKTRHLVDKFLRPRGGGAPHIFTRCRLMRNPRRLG